MLIYILNPSDVLSEYILLELNVFFSYRLILRRNLYVYPLFYTIGKYHDNIYLSIQIIGMIKLLVLNCIPILPKIVL